MSQAELAELTGISVIALSAIERGMVSDIYLSTLVRLARALGQQPAALLKPAQLVKQRRGRPQKKG